MSYIKVNILYPDDSKAAQEAKRLGYEYKTNDTYYPIWLNREQIIFFTCEGENLGIATALGVLITDLPFGTKSMDHIKNKPCL